MYARASKVEASPASGRSGRSTPLVLGLVALCGLFFALGSWQVQRRAWKLQLIAQVEQRLHAASVAAPGRASWSQLGSADAYRVVRAQGHYLYPREVQVQAVTARGPGFWVMTPLSTDDGFIVLVNRGFVPAGWRDPALHDAAASQAAVQVEGLLRLSEPHGGFLHHNVPASQRWYSRDVAAIAASRQLPAEAVAPYFIDAAASRDRAAIDDSLNAGTLDAKNATNATGTNATDATNATGTGDADSGSAPPPSRAVATDGTAGDAQPVAGLTVVRFHNSHLVYAITWYALALMTAAMLLRVWRRRA